MKKLFLNIWKGILYLYGGMFIFMSIISLLEWGNIIVWLISIMFWLLMLPIIYWKVREFIFNKYSDLSKAKFVTLYVVIVFFWYMISYWILEGGTMKNQLEEKNAIERITKLNVEYNINDSYTTEEKLEIKLTHENLESLEVNWKKIDLIENSTIYNYPLELWENKIQIVWINKMVTREISKNIERISPENLQAKVEQEELEKQRQLEEQKKKEEAAQKQRELQEQERVKTAIDRLNKEIESINNFNWDTYKESIDNLTMEVVLFGAYAIIIDDYINDKNDEVKKIAKQLETKVSQLQSKEFPKMRKAYVDLVDRKMWEHNIDVYSKWSYNWTIEFVWWTFANNKNKLDFYVTIKDMLVLLRFDRANFKWYEYDDEYTYWTIESNVDSKVVRISE